VAGAGAGLTAGGAGMTRLCLGTASGSTSGPFWPQPSIAPVRQMSTASCAIFMMSSIPARRTLVRWNFCQRLPVEYVHPDGGT
jgi:hypothetical protein